MKHLSTIACTIALAVVATGAQGCSKKKSSSSSSTIANATSSTTTSSNTSTVSTNNSSSAPIATAAPTTPVTPGPTYANNGTGIFTDGSAMLPDSSTDDFAIAIADFDGDGDNDIFIGAYDAPSRILENDKGVFTLKAGAFPALSMKATSAFAVDIDKDLDLDLIVSSNHQPIRVFENDGTGNFTLNASLAGGNTTLTYKLGVGDMNGDGYADIFMANAGQSTASRGQNRLFLNDGAGTFNEAPAGMVPAFQDDSIAALLIDFDKDGDLDVFVANFGTPHRLYENDGAGMLTDRTDAFLPPISTNGTAALAADFNGDGYLDIYVANQGPAINGQRPQGEKDTLLFGSVSGRFTDATSELPDNTDSTFGIALIDADGDGDLDVAASTLRGSTHRLYMNLNGRFTDASANFPASNAPANSLMVGAGDLNGDNAPDLVFLERNAKPRLFLNTPRTATVANASNATP